MVLSAHSSPQLVSKTSDIGSISVRRASLLAVSECIADEDLTVFAIFNLVFIFVVYFLYPETANRTLEDLDFYFDRDSNHPAIIPIHDKVAKQSKRPFEAIEAEAHRVAATKAVDAKVVSEHVEDIDNDV